MRRLVAVTGLIPCLAGCGGSSASRPPAVENHVAVRVLPCRESIGSDPPGNGRTAVLGVAGLPASPRMPWALQTARTGSPDPASRLFAKEGLVVRVGARFRLIVPKSVRARLSIGWGNADEGNVGTTILVPGCRAGGGVKWLDFAGGYWTRTTMCAPLIVSARGMQRRVWIGLGTPCPGQRPPPQPTQS